MYMVSQTHLSSYPTAFVKNRRNNVSGCKKQVRCTELLCQVCPITHSHKVNESSTKTVENLADNIPKRILFWGQMFGDSV